MIEALGNEHTHSCTTAQSLAHRERVQVILDINTLGHIIFIHDFITVTVSVTVSVIVTVAVICVCCFDVLLRNTASMLL